MANIPEYRLRIFLAVDLVGSTAFKASSKNLTYDDNRATPRWVAVFRDFYSGFQEMFERSFRGKYSDGEYADEAQHRPKLWKIIGDELILCGRVVTVEHAATCMVAFTECLARYSKHLQTSGLSLDVKGNAWLAAFPAPNVSIPLDNRSSEDGLDTSEDIENAVDESPQKFDFLGKAIDTGFRVAKHSNYDSCSVSVQLAYILATAREHGATNLNVQYAGRSELKGVNNGTPYPKLHIDTETRPKRIQLRSSERALNGWTETQPQQLLNFLDHFMIEVQMEKPYLIFRDQESRPEELPQTYTDFRKMYQSAQDEARQRDADFEEAETVSEDCTKEDGSIPDMSEELSSISNK